MGAAMPVVRIGLARGIPVSLASELEKRVYFISDDIGGFDLVRRDDTVEAVDITLSPSGAGGDRAAVVRALEDKLNRVVECDILRLRPLPPKVLWRSSEAADGVEDVFPALVRNGMVFESGEGQITLGEPLIALMHYLDAELRAIAFSLGDAREYCYPTLLPTSVLDRFGYFGSFPQFAMFVMRLHNDADVYQGFVEDYRAAGTIPSSLLSRCGPSGYCLPPTMCYHCYHQYAGNTLDGNRVVTSKGKSFRYESKYHSGLKRLWDFTIREIVFMGTTEFVSASRAEAMRLAFVLMERLGLAGTCEVANDHFFMTGDTAGKIFSQRLMELKSELRLPVGDGETIAVGSFNFHGPFFGDAFEITLAEGVPITSGCVGFGLERLVYAFLCRHGLDPSRWPEVARRAIR